MYWLTIILFNGQVIIHGPESEGWSPRLQPDLAICEERRDYLEEHWTTWLIENGVITHAEITCTPEDKKDV